MSKFRYAEPGPGFLKCGCACRCGCHTSEGAILHFAPCCYSAPPKKPVPHALACWRAAEPRSRIGELDAKTPKVPVDLDLDLSGQVYRNPEPKP